MRDFVLEQFKKASLLSKLLLFIVMTMGFAVVKLYEVESELRVEIVECHKNAAMKVEGILLKRLERMDIKIQRNSERVSHNADGTIKTSVN